MQADGVIGKYAIGGAVGATFYLEPAATVDLDVFVVVADDRLDCSDLTLRYTTISKPVAASFQDEYIVIGGWPVQFLPPANELEQEAVEKSVAVTVEGVGTWIMTAEHLAAIALRVGRAKDYIRVLQFVEQNAVDRKKLQSILERHELTAKWKQFERKYLGRIYEQTQTTGADESELASSSGFGDARVKDCRRKLRDRRTKRTAAEWD